MNEKITLVEVKKDGSKRETITITQEDLHIGAIALGELRRNRMGMVSVGQIDKVEEYIKKTGKKKFTKKELQEIIGETQNAL
jgi:hypothetical protein